MASKDEDSREYLIHSWDEPGQDEVIRREEGVALLDEYENDVSQTIRNLKLLLVNCVVL